MAEQFIIETKDLKKNFVSKVKGKKKIVEAVKGINLGVRKGEIYGFLGPNGAGKSTTQKMFATILLPTSGEARINGYDLVKQQQQIRQSIGYVSQSGGTDSMSTGIENLVLQAQLYGLDVMTAKKRAAEFIERFQMDSFADRVALSFSGGQKRRLDLALGMINHPQILLLDEPTAGLDPQSRAYLWEEIRKLKKNGITILLTTHYLDEADKLCNTVSIIDNGVIVASGAPDKLKSDIGADAILLEFADSQVAQGSKEMLEKEFQTNRIQVKGNTVLLYISGGDRALPSILRLLDTNSLEARSISMSKPSLDDVFFKYTGRKLREDDIG